MYILECFGENVGFGKDHDFFIFRKNRTVGELIKYLDENCYFFKLEYLDQTPLINTRDKVLQEFTWEANSFITVSYKQLEFVD